MNEQSKVEDPLEKLFEELTRIGDALENICAVLEEKIAPKL